jgi:hypothetical protein
VTRSAPRVALGSTPNRSFQVGGSRVGARSTKSFIQSRKLKQLAWIEFGS